MKMTKVTSTRSSSVGGGGGIPYVVQTNDTLEGIAARYDCTPTQLLKMNKLASRLLFPGQKILVPDKTASPEQPLVHQHHIIGTISERETTDKTSPNTDLNGATKSTPSLGSASSNGVGSQQGGAKPNLQEGSSCESAKASVPVDPNLDADCLQRFLKIRCKHFTDSEGVVSGVLLVTPNCVMFDPDVSHPLVIENGADRYGMVVAMDTIVSAALYKDVSALADEYGQKSTSDSVVNDFAVSSSNEFDPTAQKTAADVKDSSASKLQDVMENEADDPFSPAPVDAHPNRPPAHSTLVPLSSAPTSVAGANPSNVTRSDVEVELAGLSLAPDMRTVLRRHVSDSGRLPSDEGDISSSGLLSTLPQKPQALSCPSELEAEENSRYVDGQRLLKAGRGKARSQASARSSISTLRHSLRRRANTLSDTLVQGAQAMGTGVGTLGDTLVQGAQAVGDTLTTGAKAVAKMPQNLVNMSSGLFAAPNLQQASSATGGSVPGLLDIQESWFGNDEAGNKAAEQMRKRQQNYALLARLQQKTAEARQHWMNMFACATSKEEYPNLFAPVEDILPYPRHLYSDLCTELPYYLCIRLDEKRRRRRLANRESKDEYEFGNKTKTEFWFTVPRDKADTLYAFLIQWTPDFSNEPELGSAASVSRSDFERQRTEESVSDRSGKSTGFVVLDVNDDEAATVHETYRSQVGSLPASLNLNREWEIVTVEEVKRRLSLLDLLETEMQPLPDGSQLSALLDERKIRSLMEVLPARAQGYPWALVYSSEAHGFSLRTLYRNMQQWDEEISPTLLVVKDTNGHLFGAIVNCPIRMSDHFYGSGESLLFTFYENFAYYRWTGENNFIVKGNNDSLSFGAGRGVYGLWLDGDLYHGRTQHCQTFDNLPLTVDEDFIVAGVEAWGFSLSGI